ncbi:hypothetical protein AEGHOMDF_2304 [Methylobacterium soli]|nr:hypothetical protein AEGHOMDF_2304 [Methylobacterium soli]
MALHLLGGLTGSLGRLALQRSEGFSLALSLSCKASYLSLADPNLPRLNDSSPRSMPCENNRVIGCGARPKPGYCGLPGLGGGLETVDDLVGFELTHVHSLCPPRLRASGEKSMKPLQVERLRNSSVADE